MDSKSLLHRILYDAGDEICLTCLRPHRDMINLSEPMRFHSQHLNSNDKGYTLKEVIEELSGRRMTDFEKLPNRICENCVSSAVVSYVFKKQCDDAFTALSSLVDHLYTCSKTHKPENKDISLTIVLPYKSDNVKKKNDENSFVVIENEHSDKRTKKRECIRNDEIKIAHNKKQITTHDICKKLNSGDNELKENTNLKICHICGKKFKQFTPFKKHVSVCTEREKQFQCKACSKCFKSKQVLMVHLHAVHLQVKPFKCDKCGKNFATKSNLNGHQIVHTRERPWPCDICRRRFVDKKSLRNHIKLHTGEKPYNCDFCDEKFITLTRMKTHVQRKHTDRNYECGICGSRFHTNSDVTTHRKKVHLRIKKRRPFGVGGQNIVTLTHSDVSEMLKLS